MADEVNQETRSAATGRDTWTAGSRPWKPCPDTSPHPRHEWLDGVKREDCPGVSAAQGHLEDPLEGANCSLCGATADNFHVPDDLWERVGLGHVQACFKCFRIAAWHAGVKNDGNPWEVRLAS